MTLATYLNAKTRPAGSRLCQTHTAFGLGARGQSVRTLHITSGDELRRELYRHVQTHQDLSSGANSVTEKVIVGVNFKLFLDVDFKLTRVEEYLKDHGHIDLIPILQEIPEAAKSLVDEATGTEQRVIIATRLPYKIHMHFPDMIVDEAGAKGFCGMMKAALQDHPLMDKDSIDTSVYRTGLRLLWCHKGGMGKADALRQEKEAHERVFGAGSWSAVYDITDAATWEKKGERTLEDLELTSIVAEEGAELTRLSLLEEDGDRKRKRSMTTTDRTSESVLTPSGELWLGEESTNFIRARFNIREARLCDARKRGETVIVPTRSRECPYAGREHKSNQVYVVLSVKGIELRCHDVECKEPAVADTATWSELPEKVQKEMGELLGLATNDEGELEVVHGEEAATADLSFLNRLLKTSVSWTLEKKSETGGHQLVPQCRECLVNPARLHNSVGNSCLFINKSTVVKRCMTCGTLRVPNPTARQIINQFNVIVLQTPNTDDNTYQQLRNEILEAAQKEGYRRDGSGMVYRRVADLSYAYVKHMQAKMFLNELFLDDERFSDNPNNIDKLEKYLKDYDSSRFPFLRPDRHYIGFKNGVVNTITCEFLTRRDIPANLTVRKYFDTMLNPDDLSTPLFDSIINYQFPYDTEVYRFLLMCIGRLFFQVQERDNWGFMIYLLGEAGSGKSTVIDIVSSMFDRVGSIADGYQVTFGLAELYDRDLIVVDDVPKGIQNVFPQQTFQSCVTGNKLPVNVKGTTGSTVDWKVPFLMGGNWRLEYLDKGQISRRVVEFEFKKLVTGSDPTLKRRILTDELGMLIYKCLLGYKEAVEAHVDEDVWRFCPDYFREQRSEMRMERNPLYRFLVSSPLVVVEEGHETPLGQIKAAFAEYMGKAITKLDHGTFPQANPKWLVEKRNTCKSCRQTHRKGCCEGHQRNNRSTEEVVRNMRLASNPTPKCS